MYSLLLFTALCCYCGTIANAAWVKPVYNVYCYNDVLFTRDELTFNGYQNGMQFILEKNNDGVTLDCRYDIQNSLYCSLVSPKCLTTSVQTYLINGYINGDLFSVLPVILKNVREFSSYRMKHDLGTPVTIDIRTNTLERPKIVDVYLPAGENDLSEKYEYDMALEFRGKPTINGIERCVTIESTNAAKTQYAFKVSNSGTFCSRFDYSIIELIDLRFMVVLKYKDFDYIMDYFQTNIVLWRGFSTNSTNPTFLRYPIY